MGLYSWFGERPHDTAAHWSSMGKRSVLLAMADAARTHLCSGYVLPPATEANCDRLAQMRWQLFRLRDCRAKAWGEQTDMNRSSERAKAREWLNAIHAAFAPPQPKDDVTKALDAEEKPVRDPVSRDEQREYEALVLQFAAAMAGDDSAEHVINLAVELADQYLEWRKMEREEFKRCKS